MDVPKYIQTKMHRASECAKKCAYLMRDVDAWFEERGYDVHDLRSGNGYSLEEIEYGNDVTDEFCAAISCDNITPRYAALGKEKQNEKQI